ncbi:MAG: type II secretion system F family protein [Pigmentiphaga sp.]|nr:type II secretion system F family protein [Pigmentiphaga sp.]
MIWLSAVLLAAGVVALSVVLAGWLLSSLPRWRQVHDKRLRGDLSEFFLFIDPARLWGISVLACAAAGTLAFVASGSAVLTVAAAGMVGATPRWLLRRLRRRRLQRFDEQLPDALLTLAAALRAGAATPSALRHLAQEAEAPLAQEFALVLREQRLGIPLDQALANLARRLPSEATVLSVAALRISAATGGNLAEALERVAVTVRSRLHLLGRVEALTAQGRMQAWVVGALPVLLLLALSRLEPDAMALLWSTREGWSVLAGVAVLETIGMLWIRRIVAIDV